MRLLSAEGHNVHIFDKAASDSDGSTKGDVRDCSALEAACEGMDVVYNLAAEHRDDVRPLSLYEEVNVGGARNVVAAAALANVKMIIFTSSVAVYGESSEPLDEYAPHNWINEYGRTKSLAEEVHISWAEADPARRLVVVRPSVVFGPGNRGNVYNLLRQIASGRFIMIGQGKNRKSMAYVDNVAAFLVHSLNSSTGVYIYNYADKPDFDMNTLVGTVRERMGHAPGTGIRLPLWLAHIAGALADLLASVFGRSLPISGVRVRKFIANTEVDARRAHDTGFQRPVGLSDGLSRTLDVEFVSDR